MPQGCQIDLITWVSKMLVVLRGLVLVNRYFNMGKHRPKTWVIQVSMMLALTIESVQTNLKYRSLGSLVPASV